MLDRFIKAQNEMFNIALNEIKEGQKKTHWMWYIFPQIHSLGKSNISKYYAFKNINEVIEYLNDDYLLNNIVAICNELIIKKESDVNSIFNNVDAIKLKSSMTLFNYVYLNYKNDIKVYEENIFKRVLEKYFNGEEDLLTLEIIKNENKE